MVEPVEITAGPARLVLAPDMGGGIARLDVNDCPVLRPFAGDEANPFSLACNILVPFSNRISQGGFEWRGKRYALEPNLEGEPFPIHGDGFQKVWQAERCDASVRLALVEGTFGPWRYGASQTFRLSETALKVALSVTNKGSTALPFGCGFHPWFPRSHATRLSFMAGSVWMEDAQYLPIEEQQLVDAPDWDFTNSRKLPSSWINNGYAGWLGEARIDQGQDAVSCVIKASENLGTALIYSPEGSANFFCFEPVSHPVDAFHLPEYPGLKELAPGEQLKASMTICWEAL
ncbi:MAG: aldose 1-epimerase [Stappiaceae bacterium]